MIKIVEDLKFGPKNSKKLTECGLTSIRLKDPDEVWFTVPETCMRDFLAFWRSAVRNTSPAAAERKKVATI